MAQILIKAEANWMEFANRSNWSVKKLKRYNLRTRIGSPIVIMPDGHIWGNKECLPKYVVIKIDGISIDELKRYLQPLIEGHEAKDFSKTEIPDNLLNSIKYVKRYHIPINMINVIKNPPYNGIMNMSIDQFNNSIIDRNGINIDG